MSCLNMGTIKDKNSTDLQKQKILRGGKTTQKNYPKKILMAQTTMMVWSLTQNQASWSVMSSEP